MVTVFTLLSTEYSDCTYFVPYSGSFLWQDRICESKKIGFVSPNSVSAAECFLVDPSWAMNEKGEFKITS